MIDAKSVRNVLKSTGVGGDKLGVSGDTFVTIRGKSLLEDATHCFFDRRSDVS
jgi:hypothetical protein